MTAAVVLAAGHADRMGSNKLVLPLGPGSVIGKVLEAATVSADAVYVVIGLHDQVTRTAVEEAARTLGATGKVQVVEGVPYDPGMFISVQYGLHRCVGADVVLIFPGDIPLVSAATAAAVRDAVLRGSVDAAVPVHEGRRGHPIAVSGRCIPELVGMSEHANLRQFLEAHAAGTTLVPVNDAGMLLDMDTPEDYARVRREA